MPAKSAGLLIYRFHGQLPEVLLVHPGGPFWKNKDAGAWSIPKGEFGEGEDPLEAAKRECQEELGIMPEGVFRQLRTVKQKSGKWVYAWAIACDLDPSTLESNFFEMEWPPQSGKKQSFPEVDKAEWFGLDDAREKIITGQLPLLDELEEWVHTK
jgi:predicted NUDIX family NTP pyrophosphohydrolase